MQAWLVDFYKFRVALNNCIKKEPFRIPLILLIKLFRLYHFLSRKYKHVMFSLRQKF